MAERPELRCLRVLRVVHEFHKQGYQLLRIAPGMAPSGCYWRCAITPRSNIRRSHGAILSSDSQLVVNYSSGEEGYFGWTDAKDDNLRTLVDKFAQRHAAIVEASRGDDWPYAGWYVRMLGYAEREMFPVSYADWHEAPDPRFLPLWGHEHEHLPMPPAGDAEDVDSA